MNPMDDKNTIADKEYRKKLYEENKGLYKKLKEEFKHGVSSNFRQRRNRKKDELTQIEEETNQAFEVTKEELPKFDDKSIKQQFANAGIEYPLTEEECKGLTLEDQMEINPCGTYCGKCDDYGVVCDGCRNRLGKPIWYELYSKKETCVHYACTNRQQYHDCSQCHKVPCNHFFEYPDPNMSDEMKQMWFCLRMENFNRMNGLRKITIHDTYEENVRRHRKE